MSEQDNGFFVEEIPGGRRALDLVGRLLRVAEPGAVYGPPVTAGERTVILASELHMSLGVVTAGKARRSRQRVPASLQPAVARLAVSSRKAAAVAAVALLPVVQSLPS